MKKTIHLICNAHLDPVWQWEYDEGAAEAISTFRIAANFCEEFDGFVFNHNEALLYEWIEQYDPQLFERIRRLVKEGKWHIMGGWFLQPDCNMPSGESIIRQITVGRRYFLEKFGCVPTTAINFDSFGHSRGLVQILAKSGYDSYIITRPSVVESGIPAWDFRWVGYDGSSVAVHITNDGYNSAMGKSADKIRGYIERFKNPENELPHIEDRLLVLWGIGNHGGGPSRQDLEAIAQLKLEIDDENNELVHSTPEKFFENIDIDSLPIHEKDLNPSMVGCYSSQIRIKQKHRELESLLLSVEKMGAIASMCGNFIPDNDKLREAQRCLLFNEFHDILPGSSIERAQNAALDAFGRGIDILKAERLRAFMSMAVDFPATEEGTIPVKVFNPHPYPVHKTIVCEFQLQDQNWSDSYTDFEVYHNGRRVPAQLEKEDSNLNLDWRKHIVIDAELEPMSINQFECRPIVLPEKPALPSCNGPVIRLSGADTVLEINTSTGFIDKLEIAGKQMLLSESGRLLVMQDNEDPWGSLVSGYQNTVGQFVLTNSEEAGKIAGLSHPIAPVRIIEDGEVRTVVEAVFKYCDSNAVIHYTVCKNGMGVEVDIRLVWMESNRMVKYALSSAISDANCVGQTMFGRENLRMDGDEFVAQQWISLENKQDVLLVANTGSYAGSYLDNELRLTLLHSPAYCALPIMDRDLVPSDRVLPRMDIGERDFHFSIIGGDKSVSDAADRFSQIENEPPYALSFFSNSTTPSHSYGTCMWDNPVVMLTALYKDGDGYVMRLFNPTADFQKLNCAMPVLEGCQIDLAPYEVRAYFIQNRQLKDIPLYGI